MDKVANCLSSAISQKQAVLFSNLTPPVPLPLQAAGAYSQHETCDLGARCISSPTSSLRVAASMQADGAAHSSQVNAQWREWVLKAQELEATARDETHAAQAAFERARTVHAAELTEAHEAKDKFRTQIELRQHALMQAIGARDDAARHADGLKEEMRRYASRLAEAKAVIRRATLTATEAQIAEQPLSIPHALMASVRRPPRHAQTRPNAHAARYAWLWTPCNELVSGWTRNWRP